MEQTIKKLYNALEDASKIKTLSTGTYIYIKELLDELKQKVSQMQLPVKPATCESCKWFLVDINSVDEPTENKYGYCREPDSYKTNVDGDNTCQLHRPSKLSV